MKVTSPIVVRLMLAATLAVLGFAPGGSVRASEALPFAGSKTCSTCEDLSGSHRVNNNCCESGTNCVDVASYGTHTSSGSCSETHYGCDEI